MVRFLALFLLLTPVAGASERPNILWLTVEDIGPHLGCYGHPDAVTPHLDAFAERALRYTRASSNAPICAPARTTLATGLHAPSVGAHHMRSEVVAPSWLELLPELLRKGGYYCTNNGKLDYNLAGAHARAWDVSSRDAHYLKRPEDKPFFAVFNSTTTHESQIRNKNKDPRHDPAEVLVPPYHPDIPETRSDWAQYHDRITQMDEWFGRQIAALEKAGLAENTIVFFFGDHGSGMPRGKRYAGWSGLHVPLLVHIPERFSHLRPDDYEAGGATDRLVGFVDFAPTLLSLIGEKPRDWHQGASFLGENIAPAPDYSFGFVGRADERPDESRSATDGRYLYIRNLMPHVPLLKGLGYQMKTPTTSRWKELFEEGRLGPVQSFAWASPRPAEELYDLVDDPHETKNLATSKPDVLKRMRGALEQHLESSTDLGLLPESTMHAEARRHDLTPGDFARSRHFHPAALIPLATASEPADCLPLELSDRQALATQLRALVVHSPEIFKKHEELAATLGELLGHESPEIRAGAAELLSRRPSSGTGAVETLIDLVDPARSDPFVALHALDALSRLESLDEDQVERIRAANVAPKDKWPGRVRGYVGRLNPIVVRQFSR